MSRERDPATENVTESNRRQAEPILSDFATFEKRASIRSLEPRLRSRGLYITAVKHASMLHKNQRDEELKYEMVRNEVNVNNSVKWN